MCDRILQLFFIRSVLRIPNISADSIRGYLLAYSSPAYAHCVASAISKIPPFIHSLTHLSTYASIHPSTHLNPTHSLIHPSTNSSTHPSIQSAIQQSSHTLIHPYIHPHIYPPIHSYINPPFHPICRGPINQNKRRAVLMV